MQIKQEDVITGEQQQPVVPQIQDTEIFGSFDDMGPPEYLPPDLPEETVVIDLPFMQPTTNLNPDADGTVEESPPPRTTRQEPSLNVPDWTAGLEKQSVKKDRPTSSKTDDSSSDSESNLEDSEKENIKKRADRDIAAGSGSQNSSSSSSSEDTSDLEAQKSDQRVMAPLDSRWGHNSQPNPSNKGSSATQRQNPPPRQTPTEQPLPRFQSKSQQKPREFLDFSTKGKLSTLAEHARELSPLDRLADNVAKLKNQKNKQDLYDKANSLYTALSALSQESQEDDPDLDISRLTESDEEELSVGSYVFMTNTILECDPASPKYAELIDDFNEAAQKASGNPSRGWQIVGVLMMALGAALMAAGALAFAGTLGLAAPIAGGLIGGGAFAMASGFTLFAVNRQRGISKLMAEFAKSADNHIVEEEDLTSESESSSYTS